MFEIKGFGRRRKKVEVTPVIIGALGAVSKDFNKWMEKMKLDLTVEMLEKPFLFGTSNNFCRSFFSILLEVFNISSCMNQLIYV